MRRSAVAIERGVGEHVDGGGAVVRPVHIGLGSVGCGVDTEVPNAGEARIVAVQVGGARTGRERHVDRAHTAQAAGETRIGDAAGGQVERAVVDDRAGAEGCRVADRERALADGDAALEGVDARERLRRGAGLGETAKTAEHAVVRGAGVAAAECQLDRRTSMVLEAQGEGTGQAAYGKSGPRRGVEQRAGTGQRAVLQGVGMRKQERAPADRGETGEGVRRGKDGRAVALFGERRGRGVVGDHGVDRDAAGCGTAVECHVAPCGKRSERTVARSGTERDGRFVGRDDDAGCPEGFACRVHNGVGRGVLGERQDARRGRTELDCARDAVAVDAHVGGRGVENDRGRAACRNVGVISRFGRGIDAARRAVGR